VSDASCLLIPNVAAFVRARYYVRNARLHPKLSSESVPRSCFVAYSDNPVILLRGSLESSRIQSVRQRVCYHPWLAYVRNVFLLRLLSSKYGWNASCCHAPCLLCFLPCRCSPCIVECYDVCYVPAAKTSNLKVREHPDHALTMVMEYLEVSTCQRG